MGEIGVIAGSGFEDFKLKEVVFLQRHGKKLPPHKIDHKKNLLSLKNKGVKTIIAFFSVGSLKKNIIPGSIVVPHDYINLLDIQTYHELKSYHVVPGLDEVLRQRIISAAKKINLSVIEEGVYIQTKGPRFETKAEVNMIKEYADIVGMTMANEATLAKELGIKYAAICSVDNFAHGLSKTNPRKELILYKEENRKRLLKLLKAIL